MKHALLVASALLILPMPGRAEDKPRLLSEADLQRRAALVTVFVPPEYPAQALRDGIQASVDVVGVVAQDGTLRVTEISSSVDRDDFRAAVADVTRFWLLSPNYGRDCRPREIEGTVRVWFEVKDGKPVVSMSVPTRPGFDEVKSKQEGAEFTPIRAKPVPAYPRAAVAKKIQGSVEALLRLDPAGNVEEVVIIPGPYAQVFASSVSSALSRWQYPQAAPDSGYRCVLVPVEFRMSPRSN
jgi:TonB family protein